MRVIINHLSQLVTGYLCTIFRWRCVFSNTEDVFFRIRKMCFRLPKMCFRRDPTSRSTMALLFVTMVVGRKSIHQHPWKLPISNGTLEGWCFSKRCFHLGCRWNCWFRLVYCDPLTNSDVASVSSESPWTTRAQAFSVKRLLAQIDRHRFGLVSVVSCHNACVANNQVARLVVAMTPVL